MRQNVNSYYLNLVELEKKQLIEKRLIQMLLWKQNARTWQWIWCREQGGRSSSRWQVACLDGAINKIRTSEEGRLGAGEVWLYSETWRLYTFRLRFPVDNQGCRIRAQRMERASHADGEVITWELELQTWKWIINYGRIREKQEEKVKGRGWETHLRGKRKKIRHVRQECGKAWEARVK